MTAAAVAALAVRARGGEPDGPAPTTRWGRRGLVLAAAGTAVATWLFAIPIYRAEALRYAARQAIDDLARRQARAAEERAALGPIRTALEQAVAVDPRNAQAWADLAYATALWAHVEPARAAELGAESERQAQRALAGATIVPEFWIRRGVALDLQGRRIEAGRAFVRALQLAPARATVWYYHAFHLALDRNDPGRALAAVDFCLYLDPNNPDALALRRRLAIPANQP
jgi:tetratricopeptide (TPR) repeat protein